jgi:hypothetical protein
LGRGGKRGRERGKKEREGKRGKERYIDNRIIRIQKSLDSREVLVQ